MTNAEVIETLRANYPDACYEQLREAVDAAIEALKAQDVAGDTISRQAAIDALSHMCSEDENGITVSRANVNSMLRALPPAQPEIIRCKDCKHWMPYDWMFSEVWQSQNMDDYPEDEIGCAYCDMNMSANDFCSRPERRTDENN